MSELLRARFASQQLTVEPARTAVEAVRRVFAIQGQDPRGFRLAVRARTAGVTAADVDRDLDERRLVVSWLNRGTLHLVTAEDFWLLHDLTTPPLAATSTLRLRQEGVSPEAAAKGVDVVVAAVAERPRTREELRQLLDAAEVPTRGQALVHVLLAATLAHALIRGPMRDGEHEMVLAEQWLGPRPPFDRDEALATLAARYLAGHGPATDRDLAYWAKLPLRDVRTGLAAIETVDAGDGLVDLPGRQPPPSAPTRLLGNFDPVLHGWASRAAVLGDHDADVVTGGIYRSWAMVAGAPAALWRIDGGRVRIAPFAALPPKVERTLLRDAEAVGAYLGLPPKSPTIG